MSCNAKLRFLYSTMNSGKTLRLLTMAHNFEEKNIPFIVLKPAEDTRDGDGLIKSRVGLERECVMVDSDMNIYKAIEEYDKILQSQLSKLEWILVDECQFLTREQVDQLAKLVDHFGIDVMCFGLRTDFQTNMFEGSQRLMELADDIEELKARCSCGRKTIINARFDEDGEIVLDGNQIMVGGNETYTPLCRQCYDHYVKAKLQNNLYF